MTKQTEALKLALEKVQEFKARWWKVPPFGNKINKVTREAITNAHSPIFELEHAIREALAEQPAQQQEPVAWKWENKETGKSGVYLENPEKFFDLSVASIYDWTPLYTSPPAQRKPWVGLTDEERDELLDIYITAEGRARAIEAKLKEKNT